MEEALHLIRDERRAECDLLSISSASRYKISSKEGLVNTHCPPRARRAKDSFSHMFARYDLTTQLERGAASTSFLVSMARKTLILDLDTPRPFGAA